MPTEDLIEIEMTISTPFVGGEIVRSTFFSRKDWEAMDERDRNESMEVELAHFLDEEIGMRWEERE
ncbi:DUF7167 family protein [Streptomyces sp. BI20]|uniref:DUF7167 family protein n=1 Tax=Streptomyces sp. BI20 TaxID=3403460 RepID=UPI003C79532B